MPGVGLLPTANHTGMQMLLKFTLLGLALGVVLGRGAVVLLITDGWDRGDPEMLRHEIARLQHSCYRLIWLNPLLGSDVYEPLTRGAQALLPFVDDFLRFPPSLIVEITSRRTQMADRNVKFKLYESNKVSFYLIADPERQSTDIFVLVNGQYQLTQQSKFDLGENCHIQLNLQKLWSGNFGEYNES